MLSMIGCAVFLQLSTIHKFSMLALMSTIYVVIIRVVYKDLFDDHDSIHFCRYVVSSSGSLRGVVTQQYGSLFIQVTFCKLCMHVCVDRRTFQRNSSLVWNGKTKHTSWKGLLLALKVDFHCLVIFTCTQWHTHEFTRVNKIEAMYGKWRVNVRVEPGLTSEKHIYIFSV